MQPHEQRVIEEKRELDEKLVRLSLFIGKDNIFKSLDSEDQKLLIEQETIMVDYSGILAERIERFK